MLLACQGCGSTSQQGAKAAPKPPSVREVDARSRVAQRKVDALELELATLKRRLIDAEENQLPSLPVEVLAPEAAAAAAEPVEDYPADPALDGEYAQVVGIDEDGYEIVYAGDAARPGSVTARLPRQRSARSSASRSSSASRGSAPTIDNQLEAVAQTDERLTVTGRVGPTVAARVDEIPAPPPVPPAPAPRSSDERDDDGDSAASPAPSHAPVRARRTKRRVRPSTPTRRAAAPSVPAAAEGVDPAGLYRRHLEALRDGKHDAAEAGFQAFLDMYPRHDLSDNAQYWLGESLYDRKQYREALAAFLAVKQRFPRGNKVPDALLKAGFCRIALGEHAQARAALAHVIELFPESQPAAIAAERLESLEE